MQIVLSSGREKGVELVDSVTSLADKAACAELILNWGVYRDQGKWKELRGTFTSDGHISISWFRGPFEQFVERCRASFGVGHSWSRHHLFAPVVKIAGDRAVAETSVIIRVRQPFNGVAVDLTSCSRFLDRIERHAEGWVIAERAESMSVTGLIRWNRRPLSTNYSRVPIPRNIPNNIVIWRFASRMLKAARWRR